MSANLTVRIQYIYVYENEARERVQALSIRGVCRKRAAELVRAQYELRRHRCYCGRKDIFCEFNPQADKKECMKRRNKRVSIIAKYLQRKIDRMKKYHDKQLKPKVEFRYEFDAPKRASSGDNS